MNQYRLHQGWSCTTSLAARRRRAAAARRRRARARARMAQADIVLIVPEAAAVDSHDGASK